MQNQKYEQPKLQLVSLALNDVLLASTGNPDDPAGELDSTYTVNLGKMTWKKDIWG